MRYYGSAASIILAAGLILSCGSLTLSGEAGKNYTTEGFLDDNHFQALITGNPDPGAQGLVEKRESAFIAVKSQAADSALEKMAGFICRNSSAKRDKKSISEIAAGLSRYKKYGYMAEEYYNEDSSVVLVYRFGKKGLRQEIESTPCISRK
jgi:hypothetical protein